jgi:hypothetical protein
MYKKITTIVIVILVFAGILISCDDFFAPTIEIFIKNEIKHELQNQTQDQKNKNIIKDSNSKEEPEF